MQIKKKEMSFLNHLIYFFGKKTNVIISILLFRIILDYIYCEVVSPLYYYAGMTVNFDFFRLIISISMLFILIFLFLSISNIDKPGAIIVSLLILCSGVPTTTIITYFDVNMRFIILNLIYWILMVVYYKLLPSMKIKKYYNSSIINFIFITFGLVVFYICFKYTGFHISFDLSNVYETRTAFANYNLPVIFTYIYSASIMVFPILYIYYLQRNNNKFAILAILFQILAFSADGRKSTLFVLIITIFSVKYLEKLNARYIPSLVVIFLLISVLEVKILKTNYLVNYVIRRLFILPAYLHTSYYSFFSNNEIDFFRQSFLGKLGLKSAYKESISYIIGEIYYIGSYANNGLFSDAYANLGEMGMLIMPLLIVLVLKLLDQCSNGLSTKLCIGIIFVSAYTFLSSSFFVVLLTHGFIIGCILIYFIPVGILKNEKK